MKLWLVYAESFNFDSDHSPGRIEAVCTTEALAKDFSDSGRYHIREIETDRHLKFEEGSL